MAYDGIGGPAVGSGIVLQQLTVTSTTLFCGIGDCLLNFTTGPFQTFECDPFVPVPFCDYQFLPPAIFTVTGQLRTAPNGGGTLVASGLLVSGNLANADPTHVSYRLPPFFDGLDLDISASVPFDVTVDPDLLQYLHLTDHAPIGLGPFFILGRFNLCFLPAGGAFDATGGHDNVLTFEVDAIPNPSTLFLFAISLLVALGRIAITSKDARRGGS